MTDSVVTRLLYALGIFQTGVAALIETQRTVTAAVGEDAVFSCQMSQSKEVLQVTWQKLSAEGEKNFATYNKYFGQRVNAHFQGKVEFKSVGLYNCSIGLRQVTEQDEGCYRCVFNTYPDGAFSGATCLQLYELHQPILHVGPSDSTEEAVVSCSATGRPAPTLTLTVLRQDVHFSDYSSVSVSNANATVTVTATAVLPRFHDNSTPVRCAVQVPSGPQIEAFAMIPVVKQSSADGLDEESAANDRNRNVWIIVSSTSLVVCGAVIITILKLRLKRQKSLFFRDSEAIKTPQKPTEDIYEHKTPLFQEHEQIRHRPSTVKKNNIAKESTPRAGCQRQLFLPRSPTKEDRETWEKSDSD